MAKKNKLEKPNYAFIDSQDLNLGVKNLEFFLKHNTRLQKHIFLLGMYQGMKSFIENCRSLVIF